MAAKYFVLLEAETGKVSVHPFGSFHGVKDSIHCDLFEVVHANLLPEPFRIICDESGLVDGKPINFMASFYYGMMIHNHIIAGDCAIVKEVIDQYGEHDLDGLNSLDVHFLMLNLNQQFGVDIMNVPA